METESVRGQYTADEREQYLRLWRQSGLSQAVFCEQIGISIKTFGNWVSKPKQKSIQLLPVTTEDTIEPNPSCSAFDLIFPSGIHCHFKNITAKKIIDFIREYERCSL